MKFNSLALMCAPLACLMDPEPGAGGGGVVTQKVGDGAALQPHGSTADVMQRMQPVLDAVKQSIATAVEPIKAEHQKLAARVEQLAAPHPQGQQAFHPMRGPLPSRAERQGYSYGRAYGVKMGYLEPEKAKVEVDLSQRLKRIYFEQGGLTPSNPRSIIVPLGSELLVEEQSTGETKELPIAAEVRQMLSDGVCGADFNELQWMAQRIDANGMMRQSLSQFDDTAMGIFTHGGTQGELITLLRARDLMTRVGAREVALPPNGRLPFPSHTGATTAYYVGQSQAITASQPTTGRGLELIAKKLAALVKCPNELIRFASPSAEAFIRDDIAKTIALKASQQQLDGIGSTVAVKGLVNYSGLQTHTASTVATNGNTFEPKDVSLMLALLEEAEFDLEMDPATFLLRPKLYHNILERRVDAVSAADGAGAYLFPMNRDGIDKGLPATIRGTRVVRGSQVSQTRTKGSGTDLSYVLLGVFSNWVHGRAGVLEFAQTTTGDTAFQNDETWMRAIMHHDAGPLRENAFVLCDQIDMDLPA